MFALQHPWSLARSNGTLRRVLLLIVLGAVLYGLGVQAARACLPAVLVSHVHSVSIADGQPEPCGGDAGVARAFCESHCRSDAQSTRASLNFDLPAAVPVDVARPVGPIMLVAHNHGDTAPPPRDSGPPLHVLFHRFLH